MRRRSFLQSAAVLPSLSLRTSAQESRGAQRLPLEKLRAWQSLGYGMFLHFGMSTFDGKELPNGNDPASLYNPDRLDVDQWMQVARDAGMRYAVLTAKHVAGHCLWPSKFTDYNVSKSGNTTDVIEAFVKACERRGVLPGLYYCSWDNHNRFGSATPSFTKWEESFTTSKYQDFQTAQLTELLTNYGPIKEIWIDIPGVLGRGYRTYLYEHMASLQPDCLIMMNSGLSNQENYDVAYAWPADLISLERHVPLPNGYPNWREIEGKRYFVPGEVCDTLGKNWFWVAGDRPRPDTEILEVFKNSRNRGANLLLDVPPDTHGLIEQEKIDALMRLKKSAGI